MFSRHRRGAFFLTASQHYYHMHDQHKFSAQAFASMAFELHRHTRPLDGEDDEDLQERPADGASVLSSCSSYGSMPALVHVHTGEVHVEPEWKRTRVFRRGVWEDITRGDGDTTRGDGDTEDTGEPAPYAHDGHCHLVTASWIRYWCHAYSIQRSGRRYVDVTHGGGATMVLQANDTNMHEQLRKEYIALMSSGEEYTLVGHETPVEPQHGHKLVRGKSSR